MPSLLVNISGLPQSPMQHAISIEGPTFVLSQHSRRQSESLTGVLPFPMHGTQQAVSRAGGIVRGLWTLIYIASSDLKPMGEHEQRICDCG